jgi:hypothetical protein
MLTKQMIETAKNVCCEKCNSEVLKQAYVVKEISALMSPDGKQTLVPVPVFVCNSCDHLNSMFADDLKLNNGSIVKP